MNETHASFASMENRPPQRQIFKSDAIAIEFGSSAIRFAPLSEDFSPSPALFRNTSLKVTRTDHFSVISLPPFIAGEKFGYDAGEGKVTPFASPFLVAEDHEQIHRLMRYAMTAFEQRPRSLHFDDGKILFVSPVIFGHSDRESTIEFFRKLLVIGFFFLPSPTASLAYFRPVGQLSGVVIDIGHMFTTVSVVFEGRVDSRLTLVSPVGGKCLTEYMHKLLLENYSSHMISYDQARSIKEAYSTFENQNPVDVSSLLQSKEQLIIKEAHWKIPEVLFDPVTVGYLTSDGIPGMFGAVIDAFETIRLQRSDHARFQSVVARDLFYNVFVVGGGSKILGVAERVKKMAVDQLVPFIEARRGGGDKGVILQNTKKKVRVQSAGVDNATLLGARRYIQETSNDTWVTDVELDNSVGMARLISERFTL